MKNVHILPTSQLSRLQKNNHNKLFLSKELKSYSDCTNQNIYITNYEEIKVGDWIFDIVTKRIEIAKFNHNDLKRDWKKIILTTDQDLDGVQAIDDEFLEWFIKNPSCEQIEVYKNWNYPLDKRWQYKIIIPQEEPKQETLEEAFYIIRKSIDYEEFDFTSFELGAKWQQEQDKNKYSESDMNEFAMYVLKHNVITPKEWFEKFKNK